MHDSSSGQAKKHNKTVPYFTHVHVIKYALPISTVNKPVFKHLVLNMTYQLSSTIEKIFLEFLLPALYSLVRDSTFPALAKYYAAMYY